MSTIGSFGRAKTWLGGILKVLTFAAAAVAVVAASADRSIADALPPPAGEVVLTISGAIANTTDGAVARMDMAMLESLPATRFRTSTLWTEGRSEFVGVELDDLLAFVGAEGASLNAIALNDYRIEIPVADAVDGGPIIAYRLDGDYMSRRRRGPLWIVYPYDLNSDYQSEVVYSRSIWQLDRIAVIE